VEKSTNGRLEFDKEREDVSNRPAYGEPYRVVVVVGLCDANIRQKQDEGELRAQGYNRRIAMSRCTLGITLMSTLSQVVASRVRRSLIRSSVVITGGTILAGALHAESPRDGFADYFKDTDGNGASSAGDLNNRLVLERDIINFTTSASSFHIKQSQAQLVIRVLEGIPVKMAVLIDTTNFAGATWGSFIPNPVVNVGSTEGWHTVWIGLRGLLATSPQAWDRTRIKLDTTPPTLVITNPSITTLSQPLVQLLGYVTEAVDTLTCDLTNSTGLKTNQSIHVTRQEYSTNSWEYTTNYFQAFDLRFTNGVNTVILRATDLAGNTTTTNVSFTLQRDSTAPLVTFGRPFDGILVNGDTITIYGALDDTSATISVTYTNSDGDANSVPGIVERNGAFWFEDFPVASGTNYLSFTSRDVWGNTTATNISFTSSAVQITMNDLTDDELRELTATVTGKVSDSSYAVWINGKAARVDTNGNWTVEDVTITDGGTAVFNLTVYPANEAPRALTAHNGQNPSTAHAVVKIKSSEKR